MRQCIEDINRVLALARADLRSFIVRAHAVASDTLKKSFPQTDSAKTAAEREELLRNEVPLMLWHDLRRLRIVRNNIEHESFVPSEGDRNVTVGTLKNLAEFLGKTTAEPASKKRDWQAFQTTARLYFESLLGVPLAEQVEQQLPDGQSHHFDLGSNDASILIECKSYTWTKSGNEPAAKLNNAKTDAHLLKASVAKRKLLVFEDDLRPKTRKSLAELFARRNHTWLADVEVWRCLDGEFTQIRDSVK
jgi:hypothetical protein